MNINLHRVNPNPRCSDRSVKLTDPPKRQVTATNY